MSRPNVFWISIDSLRRDFLYTYNSKENRSTYLDELAGKGCVFDDAYAAGNWTMPSHASMLAGMDATSHMIWSWQHRFDPGTRAAFDFFQGSGDTTGCFAISQLRDLFGERSIDYSGCTDDALLLKCLEAPNPFFVFWHTYNVHYPYGMLVPRDYDDGEADYDHRSRSLNYLRHLVVTGRTEIIQDSYRREIRRAAKYVRGVCDKLRRLGKLDQTYFVITADHGEAWEPHTTFHCNFKEQVVRVPLAITGPGLSPGRISSSVSQVSLLPTILELCGIDQGESVESFDGSSLVPLMRQGAATKATVVIAGPHGMRGRHRYLAIRNPDWMLIKAMDHWWESFHEIAGDTVSTNRLDHPIGADGSKILDEFRSIAERHRERFLSNKDRVVELSKDTEKKLRALGYV